MSNKELINVFIVFSLNLIMNRKHKSIITSFIHSFLSTQMMSAIKSGHVAYSRFARMAEMEEEHHEKEKLAKKISVERSGGGL